METCPVINCLVFSVSALAFEPYQTLVDYLQLLKSVVLKALLYSDEQ